MMPEAWYVALLVGQMCLLERPEDRGPCEVQVRLLRAADPDAAYLAALELGATFSSNTYTNAEGEAVAWEFLGLADLDRLLDDEVTTGMTVYSWFADTDPASLVLRREQLSCYIEETQRQPRLRDLS